MIQDEKSRAQLKIPSNFDFQKYEKMGVDIGLLLWTLRRSPTERAEDNLQMLLFVEEAKKAREKTKRADPQF